VLSLLILAGCAHINVPAKTRQAAAAGERPVCRPSEIVAQLDRLPQPELSWLDRKIGALTTPFKYAGI